MDGQLEAVARRAADGDAVAFASLVRITQADVWRACAALVDAQSAEDLAQETFLRTYRALPTYDGRSAVRTWLLSIARHVCLDEIRARTRRDRLVRMLPSPVTRHDPLPGAELWWVLEGLPAERRVAFVMTQVVGLTYAEAAEVGGCAVGTIRSRVARAREQLVAELTRAERSDDGERPTRSSRR